MKDRTIIGLALCLCALLFAVALTGCTTVVDMDACARMCQKFGVQKWKRNNECVCNDPPNTVRVE